ncbi:MAG: hypothetical protein QM692_05580 [Thermomicrobiales bacterium]
MQLFRQNLVVDLFTQSGSFWGHVRWIRQLAKIRAETRMPPVLSPDSVHFPALLKPEGRSLLSSDPLRLREWMALLHVLHEAVVPEDLKVVTRYANSLDFWMGFLSACVIYDPPGERLLEFAEHGVAAYGDFVDPFNPWADADDDGPQMLASPIRFLPDPDQLIADERYRQEWILKRIQESLAKYQRIPAEDLDLLEMASHFEFIYEGTEEIQRRARRLPDEEMRPYIEVTPQTTEIDVRNAFRLMAAHQPVRPQPSRRKRNPLLCLQCAVWYDQCGWSQERIAGAFGWSIQRPAGAKPKSETARKHIADGRILLGQRKVAA